MSDRTVHSNIMLFDSPEGERELRQSRLKNKYEIEENSPEIQEYQPQREKPYENDENSSCDRKIALSECKFCPLCGHPLAGEEGSPECGNLYGANEQQKKYVPSQTNQGIFEQQLKQERQQPLYQSMSQKQHASETEQELDSDHIQAKTYPAQGQVNEQEDFYSICLYKFEHELFTDSEKFSFFDQYYGDYSLNVFELYNLLRELVGEEYRLEIVEICKENITDLNLRWDSLLKLFKSMRNEDCFKKLIE